MKQPHSRQRDKYSLSLRAWKANLLCPWVEYLANSHLDDLKRGWDLSVVLPEVMEGSGLAISRVQINYPMLKKQGIHMKQGFERCLSNSDIWPHGLLQNISLQQKKYQVQPFVIFLESIVKIWAKFCSLAHGPNFSGEKMRFREWKSTLEKKTCVSGAHQRNQNLCSQEKWKQSSGFG